MNRRRMELIGGCFGLAVALVLLAAGFTHTRKVYDQDSLEYGVLFFQRISDRQLVVDATFSGVVRHEGRLISTYDRTVARGKQPCPT